MHVVCERLQEKFDNSLNTVFNITIETLIPSFKCFITVFKVQIKRLVNLIQPSAGLNQYCSASHFCTSVKDSHCDNKLPCGDDELCSIGDKECLIGNVSPFFWVQND